LSAIDGLDPNGTWGLEVTDDAASDTGTLTSWSLHFAAGVGSETSITTDTLGNAVFDLAAGPHTLQAVAVGGQSFTVPVSGKYSVTAAGTPLTGRDVGVRVGAQPTFAGASIAAGQRSRILSATLNFSEAVTYYNDGTSATGAFVTVTPPGGGGTINIPATVTLAGTTATLAFPADAPNYRSLPDGKFSISVQPGSFRDADGNFLSTSGTTASHADFYRLFGDVDGDGTVSGSESLLFGNSFNNNDPVFDFNDDGTINGADLLEFGNRFGVTI
jgi:hypothetical protein